jgi:hypothetical protein
MAVVDEMAEAGHFKTDKRAFRDKCKNIYALIVTARETKSNMETVKRVFRNEAGYKMICRESAKLKRITRLMNLFNSLLERFDTVGNKSLTEYEYEQEMVAEKERLAAEATRCKDGFGLLIYRKEKIEDTNGFKTFGKTVGRYCAKRLKKNEGYCGNRIPILLEGFLEGICEQLREHLVGDAKEKVQVLIKREGQVNTSVGSSSTIGGFNRIVISQRQVLIF